jgi:hypothetical protein
MQSSDRKHIHHQYMLLHMGLTQRGIIGGASVHQWWGEITEEKIFTKKKATSAIFVPVIFGLTIDVQQ